MIPLDDVVLRDDLDPRLGQRDDDLIQQYAEIFDELPPIEINHDNELIDGWHRVRAAERADRNEIAYVVVETDGDADLRDRMYAANLRHGVQYTREQKKAYGITLHERKLAAKEIARLSGVGVSTVYRWTTELRDQEKEERDERIHRLRNEGYSQQEIADELQVAQRTISEVLSENSLMRKTANGSEKQLESAAESEIEAGVVKTGEAPEVDPNEFPESNLASVETEKKEPELDPPAPAVEANTNEAATAEETATQEPSPSEEIPDDILKTADAVMVGFIETQPDEYVARLEVSANEWMTITDDSLSNERERELLASAKAMCSWQEWKIWYRGEATSAFTDAFEKNGPVYVRGRSGKWRLVSKVRLMLRRIWE